MTVVPPLTGPASRAEIKRWCLLKNGVFSYQQHVKTGLRADRYIRMSDVTSIEEVDLEDPGADLQQPPDVDNPGMSFRIIDLERAYYFTCTTATECREWIEALQVRKEEKEKKKKERNKKNKDKNDG